jgi:putative ABC transport system substrate-binding protein
MKQPRIFITVLLALLLVAGVAMTSQAQEEPFTVIIYNGLPGIFDEVIAGFQARMAELGYEEGETITYEIVTNGDELATALGGGTDLVVSVPGGIIFSSGVPVREAPILFIASRDPVAERLVASLDAPGGPITGVMVDPALEMRLDAVAELLPEADTLYVITDSSADGAESLIANLEALAEERDLTLVVADAPIGDAEAAAAALEGIPDEADAIFLLGVNPTSQWAETAIAHDLPLFADMILSPMAYGPLVAHVPDMAGMGALAANMADQILQGANPAELAVEKAPTDLILDQRIAAILGVEFPESLTGEAAMVFSVDTVGELPPLDQAMAAEPGDDSGAAAGEGEACSAKLKHPGGENVICMDVPCDVPLDSAMISYVDREPVESCPTEGVIGVCETPAFTIYHYDGDPVRVGMGCVMLQGEWTASE